MSTEAILDRLKDIHTLLTHIQFKHAAIREIDIQEVEDVEQAVNELETELCRERVG